jgi:hypothetical protein
MKAAALCVASLALASTAALAQSGSDALSACSLPVLCRADALPGEARRRRYATAGRGDTGAGACSWSHTCSCTRATSRSTRGHSSSDVRCRPAADDRQVDRERNAIAHRLFVATATASSSAGPDRVLQLSVQCRGGRTEMVIRSAPLMRRAEDHVVSYSVNDGPPVTVTIALSSSGSGIALKGDVAAFLKSLPAEGAIAFRVADRQSETLEGRYDLAGIKALVARLTGPCKWPRN